MVIIFKHKNLLKFSLISFSLIGSLLGVAQQRNDSLNIKLPTKKLSLPESYSYKMIKQCFPELDDPSQKRVIQLEKLKQIISKNYLLQNKKLKQKIIIYKHSNGEFRRMRLSPSPENPTQLNVSSPSFKYSVMIEIEKSKGQWKQLLGENPSSKNYSEIQRLLTAGTLLNEEEFFSEFGIKNSELRQRTKDNKIVQLELKLIGVNKSLRCDQKSDGFSSCICL